MDDLISRAAAIRIAEKYGCNNGSALGRHSGLADCIASEIAKLPAVDAAPVVRCMDCKNWDNSTEGRYVGGWCFCEKLQFSTSPDWFCADGEAAKNEL